MMKRSTKIVVGSLVALGMVGVVAARQFDHWDHGPGCGGKHRGQWVAKRIAWKLDLDNLQQAELEDLRASVVEGLDNMRAPHLTADQVQSVLNSEFDQRKAMLLLEQRLQSIQESAPGLISAFADFYDTLDSSQQAELGEMIEYRMADGDRHWGPRRRGREE